MLKSSSNHSFSSGIHWRLVQNSQATTRSVFEHQRQFNFEITYIPTRWLLFLKKDKDRSRLVRARSSDDRLNVVTLAGLDLGTISMDGYKVKWYEVNIQKVSDGPLTSKS